jgi:probable F420-dependent oxidoreductase
MATEAGAENPDRILELAVLAEEAGFDGVVMSDHVVMGNHVDRYPWGEFPFPPGAPWLEPLTMLAAVAALTLRLQLGTGILIAPLRPAALLAKVSATLDQISHGRLVLGVGTGWQAEEFVAEGIDPSRRGALLTEGISACRALWTSSPATFRAETLDFEDIWCEPKAVRPGGPLVLFSGTLTSLNLHRILTLGDGWIPIMGASPGTIADGVSLLKRSYEAADRDPNQLLVRAPIRHSSERTLSESLRQALTLGDAGVTDVELFCGSVVHESDDLTRCFQTLQLELSALRRESTEWGRFSNASAM